MPQRRTALEDLEEAHVQIASARAVERGLEARLKEVLERLEELASEKEAVDALCVRQVLRVCVCVCVCVCCDFGFCVVWGLGRQFAV